MKQNQKYRPRCSVPGCDDTISSRHLFPEDEYLLEKWCDALKIPNATPDEISRNRRNWRVCYRHFADEDKLPELRRKLKYDAVPVLHLPGCESEEMQDVENSVSSSKRPKFSESVDGEAKDVVGGKRWKAALTKKSLQSFTAESTSPCCASPTPSTSHKLWDLQIASHLLKTEGKEEMSDSEETDVEPFGQVMIKEEAEDIMEAKEDDVRPFEQVMIKEEVEDLLNAEENDEDPFEEITIKEELEDFLNAEVS